MNPGPEPVSRTDDTPAVAAATETATLAVHLPVDARGVALGVLAIIATVFALDWAQAFVVSLLLGILIAYMLAPPVAWIERLRIPRPAAVVIVMLAVIGALGLSAYSLRGQVQTILEQLPAAASKFSAGLARLRTSQLGTM